MTGEELIELVGQSRDDLNAIQERLNNLKALAPRLHSRVAPYVRGLWLGQLEIEQKMSRGVQGELGLLPALAIVGGSAVLSLAALAWTSGWPPA